MKKRPYYVVPDNVAGGWVVKRDAPAEGEAHFKTQGEAVRFAQKVSLEAEADLRVYDQRGGLDWEIRRKPTGVELDVWSETEALPRDVRQAVDANPDIKGIPQGQIQPKEG